MILFFGPLFIPESLKDDDPEVQARFVEGGGWEKLWEHFENVQDSKNPHQSFEDMVAN